MPPVEETLASYLSVGETSSLQAPSLPSKPLQKYAAAGQAVTSLHTMAVLQAYQGGGALSSALIFPSLNSPATISCTGTMDGWVRSSSTEKLVLCNHSLQYFWRKPVGFCFDSVQWWPHSSILDPGWDETPGSCGPVVGLCGASLVSRSPALQFQGLRVFLKYHSGQRGTPPFEEGAWLSEDIYTSSGTVPLSGVLSSISLSPCLACSPARIVATGGLLRFQVVASIAPLTIEGHLWACRSLLSGWVLSLMLRVEFPALWSCHSSLMLSWLVELASLPSP